MIDRARIDTRGRARRLRICEAEDGGVDEAAVEGERGSRAGRGAAGIVEADAVIRRPDIVRCAGQVQRARAAGTTRTDVANEHRRGTGIATFLTTDEEQGVRQARLHRPRGASGVLTELQAVGVEDIGGTELDQGILARRISDGTRTEPATEEDLSSSDGIDPGGKPHVHDGVKQTRAKREGRARMTSVLNARIRGLEGQRGQSGEVNDRGRAQLVRHVDAVKGIADEPERAIGDSQVEAVDVGREATHRLGRAIVVEGGGGGDGGAAPDRDAFC